MEDDPVSAGNPKTSESTDAGGTNVVPSGKRAFPWELIPVTAVLLLPIYTIRNYFDNPMMWLISLPFVVCGAGLWLRMGWAWAVAVVASGLFSMFTIPSPIQLIYRYGLHPHPYLVRESMIPALSLLVLVLLIVCRVRGAYRMVPFRGRPLPRWLPAVSGILGLGTGVGLLLVLSLPGFILVTRYAHVRTATGGLKQIASAQADFRSNDRDGNRVNDFWTGDVAGLYLIRPEKDGEEIRLIQLSIAGADSDPLDPPGAPYAKAITSVTYSSPYGNHWFWTLRSDRSLSPPEEYRQDTEGIRPAGRYYNVSRFGFLAYPDAYVANGREVHIMNEHNTVYTIIVDDPYRYSGRLPPGPVTRPELTDWPDEETLKSHWEKRD